MPRIEAYKQHSNLSMIEASDVARVTYTKDPRGKWTRVTLFVFRDKDNNQIEVDNRDAAMVTESDVLAPSISQFTVDTANISEGLRPGSPEE